MEYTGYLDFWFTDFPKEERVDQFVSVNGSPWHIFASNVYNCNGSDVDTVFVDGHILLNQGTLTHNYWRVF